MIDVVIALKNNKISKKEALPDAKSFQQGLPQGSGP